MRYCSEQAFLAMLLFEHSNDGFEIVDTLLLLLVDPVGQNDPF